MRTKCKAKQEFGNVFLVQELRKNDAARTSPGLEAVAEAEHAGNGSGFYAAAPNGSGVYSAPSNGPSTHAPPGVYSSASTPPLPQMGSPASPDVDTSRVTFALKMSPDGRYLAAAGAEGTIRIWRLLAASVLDAPEVSGAYGGSGGSGAYGDSGTYGTTGGTGTYGTYGTTGATATATATATVTATATATATGDALLRRSSARLREPPRVSAIFEPDPVQVLRGHAAEILDLSWAPNNFLLSASMDRTVRLWHHTRAEALGIFEHLDYVTAVAFHPRDPRLFVSGSLDGKLRLWSIQDRAVQACNALPPGNYITAVSFTRSGRVVVAGTAGGIALLLDAQELKYHTQIHVRSSTKKTGRKITGIEAVPGHYGDERVLVSSNDSRIRTYSLRDKNVLYKYKGHANAASQISASLSSDAEFVLSGSEDHRVYIWNVDGRHQKKGFFASFRKDHVDGFESFKGTLSCLSCSLIPPPRSPQLPHHRSHLRPLHRAEPAQVRAAAAPRRHAERQPRRGPNHHHRRCHRPNQGL